MDGENTWIECKENFLLTSSLCVVEEEFDEDMRDQVEKSARHLYGLIHARFVITSRGLAKMVWARKKFSPLYTNFNPFSH